MLKSIISTSRKANPATIELAKSYAAELNMEYLAARELPNARYDYLMIVENKGIRLVGQGQSFFFHPSMSKLRIATIQDGRADNMVAAMHLESGMSVLDTTLGLGSDSIVCAHIVGEQGRVVALEASKLLAFVVAHGLQSYCDENAAVTAACRRVSVINTYALDYLRGQADNAFDVVYIDPMFNKGIEQSSNMLPLRAFAVYDELDAKTLTEAKRVARQRVVVKQPYYSTLLKQLDGAKLYGGRYSRIKYAVIDTV